MASELRRVEIPVQLALAFAKDFFTLLGHVYKMAGFNKLSEQNTSATSLGVKANSVTIQWLGPVYSILGCPLLFLFYFLF